MMKVHIQETENYMNDNTIIERAVQKDADSFTELMQMYMQDMYRVALAILMNDADVADAIGDTILACWEKIGSLKKPEYFKTWLTKIVINKSNDILRHRKRFADIEEIPEEAAESNDNPELKEALGKLDSKYRVPIILYYFEGYSTEEIAQILKIPKSTVQTRLLRAREKLKISLSDTEDYPNERKLQQRSTYNEFGKRHFYSGNENT